VLILLLAIAGSVSTAVVLMGAILQLRRSLRIVRKLSFVLFVGAIAASLAVYKFSGGPLPADFEQFYTWVVTFLAAVSILRLIGLYIFDFHFRVTRGIHLAPMLAPAVQGAAYLVTGFILLKILFPTLDLAPIIATSAVGSLVLGLALQPLLTNLFAGIVISLERPFRLDDWIKVADIEGRVVEVTWRTTHVRTRQNDNLIIPNARIAEENVVNFQYPNPMHQAEIVIGVDYAAPPYRVRHALLEAVTGVKGILEKPSPNVKLINFADSAITYELEFWVDDMAELQDTQSLVGERIWEVFKARNINIPFPMRTIELAPRKSAAKAALGPSPNGRLFIAEGAGAGTTVELGDHSVVIGRDASSGLRLSDAQVSKEHARIEWTGTGYTIVDLDSTFGTAVNNVRVDRRDLKPMDRIIIGSTVLVFET
jgi:small-conductance mechanosensitive channel